MHVGHEARGHGPAAGDFGQVAELEGPGLLEGGGRRVGSRGESGSGSGGGRGGLVILRFEGRRKGGVGLDMLFSSAPPASSRSLTHHPEKQRLTEMKEQTEEKQR